MVKTWWVKISCNAVLVFCECFTNWPRTHWSISTGVIYICNFQDWWISRKDQFCAAVQRSTRWDAAGIHLWYSDWDCSTYHSEWSDLHCGGPPGGVWTVPGHRTGHCGSGHHGTSHRKPGGWPDLSQTRK